MDCNRLARAEAPGGEVESHLDVVYGRDWHLETVPIEPEGPEHIEVTKIVLPKFFAEQAEAKRR